MYTPLLPLGSESHIRHRFTFDPKTGTDKPHKHDSQLQTGWHHSWANPTARCVCEAGIHPIIRSHVYTSSSTHEEFYITSRGFLRQSSWWNFEGSWLREPNDVESSIVRPQVYIQSSASSSRRPTSVVSFLGCFYPFFSRGTSQLASS